MKFEPVAIVGQSCVLPGALTPEALWQAVQSGKNLLTEAKEGSWGGKTEDFLASPKASANIPDDKAWHNIGGYVEGFDEIFKPSAYSLDPALLTQLDPLFQWVLHAGKEALDQVQYRDKTVGTIIGNLSYPSRSFNQVAQKIWCDKFNVASVNPLNRFMSGYPAALLAQALNLTGPAYCIDAACASSLYAIKLACDELQFGHADVMVAGGVNAIDDLFLHVGFTSLSALSPSGKSRPFDKDADGLIPATGCAFVTLKRLSDAEADGDDILAVIKGIGLSNDGKDGGLLSPSSTAQVKAMEAAYKSSGIDPDSISLIECHATGTSVGDAIELESLGQIYKDSNNIPIGSLKSNLGHLVTAAGAAGILKVIAAMKAGVRPPSIGADNLLPQIKDSPFRVLEQAEPWNVASVKRAAVSAFGFGGNNAHIVLEEYQKPPASKVKAKVKASALKQTPLCDMAIVGIGLRVADLEDTDAVTKAWFSSSSQVKQNDAGLAEAKISNITLDCLKSGIPPKDLEQIHPQQLLAMATNNEALQSVNNLDLEKTSVFMGMGTDIEAARYFARQQIPYIADSADLAWQQTAKAAISPALNGVRTLGCMPNVVANRTNVQHDFKGPSFTFSAEELSGIEALHAARYALSNQEIDAAIVGAVDLSCEAVQAQVALKCLPKDKQIPGDAAVSIVLKRLADAEKDGDTIYAVINHNHDHDAHHDVLTGDTVSSLFGHAHAASGLLQVALGALNIKHQALPGAAGPIPNGVSRKNLAIQVKVKSFTGRQDSIYLRSAGIEHATSLYSSVKPQLFCYSAKDRTALINHLENDQRSTQGSVDKIRLAIVANTAEEFTHKKALALKLLSNEKPFKNYALMPGIYFSEKKLHGELAFTFPTSAGSYMGMGRDLLLAYPNILKKLQDRISNIISIKDAAAWIYEEGLGEANVPLFDKLKGGLFLTQAHAILSQEILQLKPDAFIGFSAGETAALFASGIWKDIDKYYQEVADRGVWTRALGGELAVLQAAWKKHPESAKQWINWSVNAPHDDVVQALATEPLVHLATINAKNDFSICGQADACERVVALIGKHKCRRIYYDLIHHSPELDHYETEWRALNTRQVHRSDVKVYSSENPDKAFYPNAENVAQALWGMARYTVDYPKIIESAYSDGVRIFVEHGGRSSCSSYINQILGDKEHLAVSLDSAGKNSVQKVLETCAQLYVVGVEFDHSAFQRGSFQQGQSLQYKNDVVKQPSLIKTFPAHANKIVLPSINVKAQEVSDMTIPDLSQEAEVMSAAPNLPSVFCSGTIVKSKSPTQHVTPISALPMMSKSVVPKPRAPKNSEHAVINPVINSVMNSKDKLQKTNVNSQTAYLSQVAELHQTFIQQQAEAHAQFLTMVGATSTSTHRAQFSSTQLSSTHSSSVASSPDEHSHKLLSQPHLQSPSLAVSVAPETASHDSETMLAAPTSGQVASSKSAESKEGAPTTVKLPQSQPVKQTPPKKDSHDNLHQDNTVAHKSTIVPLHNKPLTTSRQQPVGPYFDREQLKIHASGNISEIFGDLFKQQDQHAVQVRMPEEPMLLADRVVGIDAEPGSLKLGTVWTETDIQPDSWYLHQGHIPPGIMIEAGQADLFLISYLGIDFKNKGERAYRLLGCNVTYMDTLARPGDTLHYEIHIDSHAVDGDIHLFFFHYDCYVGEKHVLKVRNGHAGFFNDQELLESKGVLWSPEDAKLEDQPRLEPALEDCTKTQFNRAELEAFSEGRLADCFGENFNYADTHTRTPTIPQAEQLLLGEITDFNLMGGPWQRGYLRATRQISPDDWFFQGHFKNDPCMPGTLMTDMAFQGMAVYMAALGFTLKKDGWTFAPVVEHEVKLLCRGQVTPTSKELVLEIFVREIISGEQGDENPTIYVDILSTVDGLKALYAEKISLQLNPDYPNPLRQSISEQEKAALSTQVAMVGGIPCDEKQASDCAWGLPSEAFGHRYTSFDDGKRLARLPGDPYNFISRVLELEGEYCGMQKGSKLISEWDVPDDCIFYHENGYPTLPYCVILEAVLQPCGWLGCYLGCPLEYDMELFFRNLDGTLNLHKECFPQGSTIRCHVENTNIAKSGGTIIVSFKVEAFLGDEKFLDLTTVFGYFSGESLAVQVGLSYEDEEKLLLTKTSDYSLDFSTHPAAYFSNNLKMPGKSMMMLDRISGYWRDAGKASLGLIRGEKTIHTSEWFFQAHFFQDPVQPGSLGLEPMLQLLQFYMLENDLGKDFVDPRFEPLALDMPVTWRYRGQVTPKNKIVQTFIEITEMGHDDKGCYVMGEASLWCDGLKIYDAKNMGMRIVECSKTSGNNNSSNSNSNNELCRMQLEQHAKGQNTSSLALNSAIRLPAPPLLLLDNVTDINTQSEEPYITADWCIQEQQWYLDGNVLSAAMLLEAAGQASIVFCSADDSVVNQHDDRVYRVVALNGICFHSALPKPGDTLRYQISCTKKFQQNDTTFFFFHYQCWNNNVLVVEVENAIAALLPKDALPEAKGVINLSDIKRKVPTVAHPFIVTPKRSAFSSEQLLAFAGGDGFSCFGEGFEAMQHHTDTPRLPAGKLLQIDEINELDTSRAYLKARKYIYAEDWFFKAHFKNDPCMPAAIMGAGCFQAICFYLTACGYTLDKDQHHFEPTLHQPLIYQGGGQVVPNHEFITYELFVEEITAGDQPLIRGYLEVKTDQQQIVLTTQLSVVLVSNE